MRRKMDQQKAEALRPMQLRMLERIEKVSGSKRSVIADKCGFSPSTFTKFVRGGSANILSQNIIERLRDYMRDEFGYNIDMNDYSVRRAADEDAGVPSHPLAETGDAPPVQPAAATLADKVVSAARAAGTAESVPLLGVAVSAKGFSGCLEFVMKGERLLRRPSSLDGVGSGYAVLVMDADLDASLPLFSTLYVRPEADLRPGDRCVAHLHDGRALVGLFAGGWSDGLRAQDGSSQPLPAAVAAWHKVVTIDLP